MLQDESTIWGQAAAILRRAEDATGFTYEEALNNKEKQTERFEKEQVAHSVSIDPRFNTTAIINDQSTLGTMQFGSMGNAAVNCCGAVAVHDALILNGGQSNFADVYTHFNDDSKLNLGSLAGGTLGTKPSAVKAYLEDKGCKVTFVKFDEEILKQPGTYILVYAWHTDSQFISAHYKAVESDGKVVTTYNETNVYQIENNNLASNQNVKPLGALKSDSNMLEVEKSWPLWFLSSPVMKMLQGEDAYFSYIMIIE